MGKMRAYLPYVGYMTIMLNDYPMFKYFVLGMMAFFTIVAKDPQWWICERYKIFDCEYYLKIQFIIYNFVT